MSNLWLNIRYRSWHLQIGVRWWGDVQLSENPYHRDNPVRWEIYTLKPFIY